MAKLILGVYDTHDNETCVTMGTYEEVAKTLGITKEYILQTLWRNSKVAKRYKIERIGKDTDLWEVEKEERTHIAANLTPELAERLEAQKKLEGRTKSKIIRQALKEYLQEVN